MIAWKNGIASRAIRSGAGRSSLIVSWLPLAVTPETVFVRPARTASAPWMMSMNDEPGDCSSWDATRLIVSAKLFADTGSPVENRRPGRIRNT